MKVLYNIQDMLEDELKKVSKKAELTTGDLDNIYKMVDIVKDVSTIDAMKQGGYSQESSRGSYRSYDSYDRGSYEGSYGRRGRDGDGDGRYSEEGSYRRGGGRGSRDSYASREGGSYDGSYEGSYRGYSGHDKESMVDGLKQMMREAKSEQEREGIRRAIEQLER